MHVKLSFPSFPLEDTTMPNCTFCNIFISIDINVEAGLNLSYECPSVQNITEQILLRVTNDDTLLCQKPCFNSTCTLQISKQNAMGLEESLQCAYRSELLGMYLR